MNIREIARRAGVSPSTVSRILNETKPVGDATKARVLKVLDETGYMPNSLKRHEQTLALVVPSSFSARSNWSSAILDGLLDEAREYHLTIIRESLHLDRSADLPGHRAWRDQVRRFGWKGVLLIKTSRSDAVAKDLARSQVRYVVIGRGDEHENWVYCDNIQVIGDALAELYRRGHRRIAYIGHFPRQPDHVDRHRAYQSFTERHALEPITLLYGDNGRSTALLSEDLSAALTGTDRPSALLVGDVTMGLAALTCIAECKLSVPGDLSFVTMGHHPLLEARQPPLTLIRRQLREGGRRAVQALLGIAEDESCGPVHISLASELVNPEASIADCPGRLKSGGE